MDTKPYLKFLAEEIDVPAGRYSRAQLISMATNLLHTQAADLKPMVPELAAVEVTPEPSLPDDGTRPEPPDEPESDSPPWQEDAKAKVDDESMLTSLRSVTWSAPEPPRGKPGIKHVLEVLAWIRSRENHARAFMLALFGSDPKKPKLAKNLNDVADVVGKMPVHDSARWLFVVMREHVTPKAMHEAYAEINIQPLITELWNWGLDVDGIRRDTRAREQALQHSFMIAIAEGRRGDGEYRTKGSSAAVMKALKVCYDALTEEQRAKMHHHIMTNYDADKVKAMAPLMKIMTAKGHGETGVLVCDLLSRGLVPVLVFAMVFQGTWDRLYTSLTTCLDTTGPRPPWLDADAA